MIHKGLVQSVAYAESLDVKRMNPETMAARAAPAPNRLRAALRSTFYLGGAVLAGGAAMVGTLNYLASQKPAAPARPVLMTMALPPAEMRAEAPVEPVVEAVAVVAAPEPEPVVAAAPPRPVVEVDSVAQGFPVSAYRIQKTQTGWVDQVTMEDGGAVVQVSGWAGDPGLGLRVPYVALGACGQVVAVVRVEQPRPDVAINVHPNLDRAGWQARLFAGHLPACADRKLEAHALLPGGKLLVPLQTTQDHPLASLGNGAAADPHGPPGLIAPGDLAYAPPVRIKIAGPTALLRCAQVVCANVGQVARGEYRALMLDRRDGWSLVHFAADNRVGWVPEAAIEKLPERVAQR
jgi:hypothetical protein